ncbi:MAG: hypothetical protein ACKO3I_09600, partial [Synechococcales cyanobacterium]
GGSTPQFRWGKERLLQKAVDRGCPYPLLFCIGFSLPMAVTIKTSLKPSLASTPQTTSGKGRALWQPG